MSAFIPPSDGLDMAERWLKQTYELHAERLRTVARIALDPGYPADLSRADGIAIEARRLKQLERDITAGKRNVMAERRTKFREEQGMSKRAPVDPTLLAVRFGPNLT